MRSALAFLTVIGRAAAPTGAALAWFPVIGAMLGLAVGGVWAGAGQVWPASVAAGLALAADALLTGALHWDGLVDTGDGLLPPLPRERRLAVMSDPQVGAFGVVTLAVVILLRYTALSAGPVRVWVIAGLWAASRSAVAVVALLGRYARDDGAATAFIDGGRRGARRAAVVAIVGLAISLPLVVIDRPGHGIAAVGAEIVTIVGVTWLALRRLGGFTGDVLGAQVLIGETAGLLVWSAQW